MAHGCEPSEVINQGLVTSKSPGMITLPTKLSSDLVTGLAQHEAYSIMETEKAALMMIVASKDGCAETVGSSRRVAHRASAVRKVQS